MKISIITPFYEGKEYMERYQDCLLENEKNLLGKAELEVILINDSPWEKIELRGTVQVKKNWKILINRENVGIHASRVRGLRAADGDLILFLDQDDTLADHALVLFLQHFYEECKKRQMEEMEPSRVPFMLVANASLEQKNKEMLPWYRTNYQKKKVNSIKAYEKIGTQIISPGQCLIPAKRIPMFWTENICQKNGADDYFLWLLMLDEQTTFVVLDDRLYEHRYTNKNLSGDTRTTDDSCYEFISFLKEGHMLPDSELECLETMLHFKANFRNVGKIKKVLLSLRHLSLFLANLNFKIGSKTPYGFNR